MISFKKFLEESEKEVKDLIQLSKSSTEEEVYHKMIEMLSQEKYHLAVQDIDKIIKEPKLRSILGLGFGGELSDLKLSVSPCNLVDKRLIPTQNEIGMKESLKYLLEDTEFTKYFKPGIVIKRPVLTFNGMFIIDGHHRWSQIFLVNPEAELACINIEGNLSPISMLKAVQCTIGSNTGDLRLKASQGTSLYKASKKVIQDYIESNLTEKTKEALLKVNLDVEGLVKNCLELANNNTPILNAPKRDFMPQTSKDQDLLKDLKTGVDRKI